MLFDHNQGFARTATTEQGSEKHTVPTVHEGPIVVDMLDDDKQEEMEAAHPNKGAALLRDTPSTSLTIKGATFYLTWEEAYNLGCALVDSATTALHG